jgi:hypothetical protein
MRPGIRYYCPPGIDRPAHREDLGAGAELLPGKGPEAALGQGAGGGAVYGGLYVDREPGWQRTAAGWWVHLGGTVPQHLVRAAPHARIIRWSLVAGALPEHRWRVPVILMPQGGEAGVEPVYVSVLEKEWRGDEAGWKTPPELVVMQDQLISVAHDLAMSSDLEAQTKDITDLTLALLAIGHLVSRHEIAAGGWLSELTMLRVLAAACDNQTDLGA